MLLSGKLENFLQRDVKSLSAFWDATNLKSGSDALE